jgi:uncharacterized PurR-regulated membrane protein YhhQ (DUF165 family)
MATDSTRFWSFMARQVPVKRLHLYLLRFLFLFSFISLINVSLGAGVKIQSFVTALGIAVLVSVTIYLTDRYGQPSDKTRITLSLIVLAILSGVVILHLKHRPEVDRRHTPDSSNTLLTSPR